MADPLVVVPELGSSDRDPALAAPPDDVTPVASVPSDEVLAPPDLDAAANGDSHVQRRVRERSRSRDGE